MPLGPKAYFSQGRAGDGGVEGRNLEFLAQGLLEIEWSFQNVLVQEISERKELRM